MKNFAGIPPLQKVLKNISPWVKQKIHHANFVQQLGNHTRFKQQILLNAVAPFQIKGDIYHVTQDWEKSFVFSNVVFIHNKSPDVKSRSTRGCQQRTCQVCFKKLFEEFLIPSSLKSQYLFDRKVWQRPRRMSVVFYSEINMRLKLNMGMAPQVFNTRWYKVTFWSLWRSLYLSKKSLPGLRKLHNYTPDN